MSSLTRGILLMPLALLGACTGTGDPETASRWELLFAPGAIEANAKQREAHLQRLELELARLRHRRTIHQTQRSRLRMEAESAAAELGTLERSYADIQSQLVRLTSEHTQGAERVQSLQSERRKLASKLSTAREVHTSKQADLRQEELVLQQIASGLKDLIAQRAERDASELRQRYGTADR